MQRIIAYFFVPTCLMTSIVSSVAIAPNNESAIGPQLSAKKSQKKKKKK